jgi:hypothetical protein
MSDSIQQMQIHQLQAIARWLLAQPGIDLTKAPDDVKGAITVLNRAVPPTDMLTV